MAAVGEEEGLKLDLDLPFRQLFETNLFKRIHTEIETTATRLTINNRRKLEETKFNPSMHEIIDEVARVHVPPEARGYFKSGVALGLMIALQQEEKRKREKTPKDLEVEAKIAEREKTRDSRRAIRRDKHE